MNYNRKELRSALAGEYVLGTLQGPARRRFERLLKEVPEYEREVREWEQKLVTLDAATPPLMPRSQVWENIDAQISSTPRAGKENSLAGFWKGFGLFTSMLALVLAFLLINPWKPQPTVEQEYISIVRNAQQSPLWLVRMTPGKRQVSMQALKPVDVETGKSLELWLLPAGEQPPLSVGLLPVAGKLTSTLGYFSLLEGAKGLAVSLEPEGGSPTAMPTGPVLYQAQLFSL